MRFALVLSTVLLLATGTAASAARPPAQAAAKAAAKAPDAARPYAVLMEKGRVFDYSLQGSWDVDEGGKLVKDVKVTVREVHTIGRATLVRLDVLGGMEGFPDDCILRALEGPSWFILTAEGAYDADVYSSSKTAPRPKDVRKRLKRRPQFPAVAPLPACEPTVDMEGDVTEGRPGSREIDGRRVSCSCFSEENAWSWTSEKCLDPTLGLVYVEESGDLSECSFKLTLKPAPRP